MAKKYDWVEIERDYRTGRYSNTALSKMHGPVESTIRARVIRHGWSRDLSDEINLRVQADLQKKMVEGNANPDDEAIVAAAVDTGVELIREHRIDIRVQRDLVRLVNIRLNEQLGKETITIRTKDGVAEIDVPLEYVGKVLNNATMSLERLIRLERQAFNMDADRAENSGKSIQDLLDELPDTE